MSNSRIMSGELKAKGVFKFFKQWIACCVIILMFLGCSNQTEKQPLRVAAAGNISFVAKALKENFEKKHPGISVDFSFASSGKLTAQIMNGAPFDVFLSADMGYPERLYKEGLSTSEPQVYTTGKLILFSAGKTPVNSGLDVILDENVKIVAVANPKLATYGTAAAQALEKARLMQQAKQKFVIGENVFQTVQFTLSAADVGFITKSALFTPALEKFKSDSSNWWPVPDSLYQPIEQGLALLKQSSENKHAKTFITYILSEDARNLFKQYGYHYD